MQFDKEELIRLKVESTWVITFFLTKIDLHWSMSVSAILFFAIICSIRFYYISNF